MKRGISYARVSFAIQEEKGVSLEAQRQKIEAMSVVQGLEIVETIVDAGESAKDLNRDSR